MQRNRKLKRIMHVSIDAIIIFLMAAFLLQYPACSGSQYRENNLKKVFRNAPEETLKPTRWDSGNTSISNENRLDLFKKHVEGLGGGYVGVGTTQNFTLATWAKSEWIWLIDYTRITVAANKIHIAFLKHAPTAEEFEALWQQKAMKDAYTIIDKEYEGNADLPYIRATWGTVAHFLRWHAGVLRRVVNQYNYGTWLTDPAIYANIRSLALKGRIIPLRGDLLGSVTLMGIAKNSKLMGVPIRVIYFSNAEEFFPSYTEQFVNNVKELNIDDKTVLLRTMTILQDRFPWAPGSDIQNPLGFHYNVMRGDLFVRWIPEKKGKGVFEMVKHAKIDRANGFSIILPEAAALGPTNKK